MEESVFATPSLSYSFVHPGLSITDQLLLLQLSSFTLQPLALHLSHYCSKYSNVGNEGKMYQMCFQPKESHREKSKVCRVNLTTVWPWGGQITSSLAMRSRWPKFPSQHTGLNSVLLSSHLKWALLPSPHIFLILPFWFSETTSIAPPQESNHSAIHGTPITTRCGLVSCTYPFTHRDASGTVNASKLTGMGPQQCPRPQLWSLISSLCSWREVHRCDFNRALWGTIASDWDAIPPMLEIGYSIISNFGLKDSITPQLTSVLKGSL